MKKKAIKFLKWTGISLVTLVGLALAFVYGSSYFIFNSTFDIPLTQVTISADSASIAEGFRQTRLMHCNGCHGENMSGKILEDNDVVGTLVSANIPKRIESYTDAEIYRLIRHGVKQNNKLAFIMPAEMFYELNDESVLNIIAYLRSLEVQVNDPPLPEMKVKFPIHMGLALKKFEPEPWRMDHKAPRRFLEHDDSPVAFGEYLIHTACTHCHGNNLEGGGFMNTPALSIIVKYDNEQFRHFFKTGEPVDNNSTNTMSNLAKECFKYFTDEEVDAMFAYLRSRLGTTDAVEIAGIPASNSE